MFLWCSAGHYCVPVVFATQSGRTFLCWRGESVYCPSCQVLQTALFCWDGSRTNVLNPALFFSLFVEYLTNNIMSVLTGVYSFLSSYIIYVYPQVLHTWFVTDVTCKLYSYFFFHLFCFTVPSLITSLANCLYYSVQFVWPQNFIQCTFKRVMVIYTLADVQHHSPQPIFPACQRPSSHSPPYFSTFVHLPHTCSSPASPPTCAYRRRRGWYMDGNLPPPSITKFIVGKTCIFNFLN